MKISETFRVNSAGGTIGQEISDVAINYCFGAIAFDRVTGSDPSVTDYILEARAKCPNCKREILEKTLIEPYQVFCE
jgi:hypothetical protein